MASSSYDASKDKMISEIGSFDTEKGRIRVGIFSYNDGPHKIGIQRVGERKSGAEWASSLGRISLEEARQLLPLLAKATDEG